MTVEHFTKCCYFEVGNVIVLQTIAMFMSIDPVPFWDDLYTSKHLIDFMSK